MQSAQFQLHAEIEDRHWWFVARRKIMRRLIESLLPPDPDALVIDVGCGTGANIAALAGDYRCLGIDSSREAIELARSRFPAVEFRCGYAPDDLGEQMAEARLVCMMDVLEHVPDDFDVFSSILAAMAPGAHFLLTVPADQRLWSPHDVTFGHYRRYDLPRLAALWKDLPVTPLLASHYNARLLPVVRAARAWNAFRGHAGGAAGTDFRLPLRPLNAFLTNTFAGESRRLLATMHGRRGAYSAGVSLVALLRREEGDFRRRTKPADIAADLFDPQAGKAPAADAPHDDTIAEKTLAEMLACSR